MLRAIAALTLMLCVSHVEAKVKPLVEVGDGKGKTYQGRVESLDKRTVTMMRRDGSLFQLRRSGIKTFKQIAAKFKPLSKNEMVAKLREELGKGFVVQTTQHYIVCTPKGSKKNYAGVFENVYKAFHYQFRRRQFHLQKNEFPLVAIVFPGFQDFAKYAAKDGVRASPGLLGYYHRMSNRVAVYESSRRATLDRPLRTGQLQRPLEADDNVYRDTGSGADLESTITHETIHQVSFNTGIHPRLGHAPRWIIEGLAMTFESPGFLATSGNARGSSRLNRDRLVWFKGYSQTNRPRKSLKAFVESGRMFQTAALDAYSQSWALTFFFMDQPARAYKFGRYIRAMNQRELTAGYTAKDRLADFENAFGDVERVETDFLRFMRDLDPNAVASR
ncbi:MAG: DUF1570 domain-containing protein [Planctomycetaceae bacterium]